MHRGDAQRPGCKLQVYIPSKSPGLPTWGFLFLSDTQLTMHLLSTQKKRRSGLHAISSHRRNGERCRISLCT